ncbi:TonB-dependent receptor [Psychrilyobacter atlanticus]|uniref:TonB-dependent receptor n=1 Tax=Psychrilyobacter atlanticus TaxID=271091 RepID=UPI0003FD538D|nr:TonB-dependent receptor [Psychrilyobacter atlanticus]
MIKRAGVLALILACTVYAEDLNEEQFFEDSGVIRLEETTISGDGFENTIRDTPKNITIVTAQDIKESGAKNVVEAVKSVPGVKVSEGTGKTGVIDIRGQGANTQMNTAIIVDGVKMNPIDMSSFNLYSIPIETVEKIEIIPSGASVVYGDNTVGGAINIITKNGKGKDSLTLQVEGGSYENYNGNLGFNTTVDKFKIFGNVTGKTTDGYRENGYLRSQDVMVGTKYQINDANALTLKYDYHKDHMGFPGSLSKDQTDDDRTQASSPDDWGKNESHRFNLGYNYKKDNLEIINNTTYYTKNYNSYMTYGSTSTYSNSDAKTENISNDFKVKYNTDRNKFIAGFDLLNGDLDNKSNGLESDYSNWPTITTKPFSREGKVKKESIGGFISDTYSLTDDLDFTGGIRQQYTKFDYSNYEDKKYNTTVYDLALNYKYSETGSTFISYGTDFRTPTTDELVTYGVYNPDLKPQTGENFEIGVKDYIAETFVSASVFHKIIKDEIYYNSSKKINSNYDEDNKKIGFELLAERKFMKNLTLTTSYSYLQSEIDGGENKGNKTPGVPENKFSIGAKYDFTEKLKSNLLLNYVGSSYSFYDEKNEKDKVEAYTTLDFNLSYKINDSFDIYGGIKNLTDEEYNEYVDSYGYYYPAPERQYYVGFRYTM